MGSLSVAQSQPQRCQHVVVMRHGDRLDDFEESWVSDAARPWDPPLIAAGHLRAFRTGRDLRDRLGFPIHRVIVSPFLRCVETAARVVSALCAIEENPDGLAGTGLLIDPSMIKILDRAANRNNHPEDWDWGFNLSELEQKLPPGTVDPEFKPVVQELPKREETLSEGVARFGRVIHALADKYPSENLMLITHGEGLRSIFPTFMNGTRIRNVEYCAHFGLQRQVTMIDNCSSTAGKFSVVSHHGYSLINEG